MVIAVCAQRERHDTEDDFEYERVSAEPPREHDCPDQRCDEKQDAESDGCNGRECKPPAPVIELDPQRRRQHEAAPLRALYERLG